MQMPSVYDSDNYAGRVNYAATVISRNGGRTRHFDTCFEMHDGDMVALALWRRAQSNPKLAERIPRYLNVDLRDELLARYADLPARKMAETARQMREKAKRDFDAFMTRAKAEGRNT
jgi:hypothetical protein